MKGFGPRRGEYYGTIKWSCLLVPRIRLYFTCFMIQSIIVIEKETICVTSYITWRESLSNDRLGRSFLTSFHARSEGPLGFYLYIFVLLCLQPYHHKKKKMSLQLLTLSFSFQQSPSRHRLTTLRYAHHTIRCIASDPTYSNLVPRRSANYKPSSWDIDFAESLESDYKVRFSNFMASLPT